jgi:hypothetical protein
MSALVQLVLGVIAAFAPPPPAPRSSDTPLPITVLDMPFDARGFPSMAQSLDLAYALHRTPVWALHKGVDRIRNRRARRALGVGLSFAIAAPLVLVDVWMHEEWHRAVMTQRGITSRDAVYDPAAWSHGFVGVDRVSDEDLARLKRDHPADTVRLMTAGFEAHLELAKRTGDHAFHYGDRGRWWRGVYLAGTWMAPTIAINELSVLVYYGMCASERSDRTVDADNRAHTTVASRDFTGLDCIAYSYDLHRPDEPYAARGPHPYGAGVDRYRSWSDLSGDEQRWLRRQLGLHVLDLLNPHLFGIDGFRLRRGRSDERWIVQAMHGLTPFGATIDAHVGIRRKGMATFVTLRNGWNARSWFPSLALRMIDITHPRAPIAVDVDGELWLQPERLRFDTRAHRLGARVAPTVHFAVARALTIDVTLDAKTAGYVPGNVFLAGNTSFRLGFTARL